MTIEAFRSDAPFRHQFDVARDPYAARNALGIDTVLASYLTTANAATTYATMANFPATAWTAWTPTISASSGTITSSTINRARYIQLGKTIIANVDVTITNVGTAGAAAFRFTLPVTASASGGGTANGRETDVAGVLVGCAIGSSATFANVVNYLGGGPLATNARFVVNATYEVS